MAVLLCLKLLVVFHVATTSAMRVHTLEAFASNASDSRIWPFDPPEQKKLTLEDAGKSCPLGTQFLVDKVTKHWLGQYQDEGNGIVKRLFGLVFATLFFKDKRTHNLEDSFADKFTVGAYAALVHLDGRAYSVRHSDSVPVPSKIHKSDLLQIGNILAPFVDIDNGIFQAPSSLLTRATNCIFDILRSTPFDDWLDDPEHNNWDLISTMSEYESKKDYIYSFYKHYTFWSGEPVLPAEEINLRQHFFKNDQWDDKLEMAIAFDIIGTHRVQPASREFGGETLTWALKMNFLAAVEVRPHFGQYGADMYFTEEGMPALVVTPEGVEVPRGSKDWQYWKFVWRSTLVAGVTLIDHLHAAHFRGANILARLSRETMSPDHAFRRLLTIFTFGSIEVNINAMHTLIGPDSVLHRMTPFKEFEDLSQSVPASLPDPLVAHRHFLSDTEWDRLPQKLKTTPYFQDGRELFRAISKFVHSYSGLVDDMCDDHGVLVDPEVILFRDASAALNQEGNVLGEWDHSNTCEVHIKRLVSALWTVTGWHRHVGQVIEYVFDPDLMAFSWKDGEPFGRPKQSMITSALGATTAKTQPKLSEDYTHVFAGMKKEAEAVQLWKTFQEDLKVVKRTVADNNKDREVKNFHADPDIVECSIAV